LGRARAASAKLALVPAGTPCIADDTPCTLDVCDDQANCRHLPHDGCTPAAHADIALSVGSGTSNRLLWRWIDRSGTTTLADLGTPTVSTDVHLCVFSQDERLLVDTAALSHPPCAHGPCWRAGAHGFTYTNSVGLPSGARKVVLKSSAAGTTKLRVKAGGPTLGVGGLPYDTPSVRAQLVTATGSALRCWESAFDHPSVSTQTEFDAHQ
jgi:hypothetical protein